MGGAVGGSLAGISASALGRAAGSIAGGLIDQQVFGRGSAAVETGRVESFRVQSAVEGAPVPKVYGRDAGGRSDDLVIRLSGNCR